MWAASIPGRRSKSPGMLSRAARGKEQSQSFRLPAPAWNPQRRRTHQRHRQSGSGAASNVNVGVAIVTAEHPDTLYVPREALRRDGDGKPYVFEVAGGSLLPSRRHHGHCHADQDGSPGHPEKTQVALAPQMANHWSMALLSKWWTSVIQAKKIAKFKGTVIPTGGSSSATRMKNRSGGTCFSRAHLSFTYLFLVMITAAVAASAADSPEALLAEGKPTPPSPP